MKILLLAVIAVMYAVQAYAYPVTAPEGKTLKVHWAVLEAKTDRMSEMAAISARTVAKYTPNESGSYSLYGGIDSDNPDRMLILEIYEDEAAYQVHRNSEGFKAFVAEREPILEQLMILPVDPVVLEQKAQGIGHAVTMSMFGIKRESLDGYKALIAAEMSRAVRDDAGVLGLFATAEQGDRNNVIHIMGIYADDDSYKEYISSTQYQEFVSKTDSMINTRHHINTLPANIILSGKGLHLDD